MGKLILTLLCFCGFAAFLSAQTTTKSRPSIGLQGGYMAGQIQLKGYPGSFEDYSAPFLGLTARFRISRQLQIQPELSFYKRRVQGNYEDIFLGNYYFFIDQKGTEAGLLVRYEPWQRWLIRPYISGGITMGFLNPKVVSQRISTGALQNDYTFKINSNDTNGILEAGILLFADAKVKVGLSGRYYLSGNNATLQIINLSGALQGSTSHAARLDRWQAQLGVFYQL